MVASAASFADRVLSAKSAKIKPQEIKVLLSVWHKRLLRATLDMHDMQENLRQSNFQLFFFLQTI